MAHYGQHNKAHACVETCKSLTNLFSHWPPTKLTVILAESKRSLAWSLPYLLKHQITVLVTHLPLPTAPLPPSRARRSHPATVSNPIRQQHSVIATLPTNSPPHPPRLPTRHRPRQQRRPRFLAQPPPPSKIPQPSPTHHREPKCPERNGRPSRAAVEAVLGL